MTIGLYTCPKGHTLDIYDCPDCDGDGFLEAEFLTITGTFPQAIPCHTCNGVGYKSYCDECGRHY